MQRPLLIFSRSDYLIQIIDINSHTEGQTVQILISWLLQKPTDLDLHCLQRQGISGFSRTMVKRAIISCKWPASVAQSYVRPTGDQEVAGLVPTVSGNIRETDHEIFSMVILSLLLIQEGQLSVSGERMCISTG